MLLKEKYKEGCVYQDNVYVVYESNSRANESLLEPVLPSSKMWSWSRSTEVRPLVLKSEPSEGTFE